MKDPNLKGVAGGNCNRSSCQAPGAVYFNRSTRKFYCRQCAATINEANGEELCTLDPEAKIESK